MNLGSLNEALGTVLVKRELRAGDYVHHQGDFAETVSFVHSGQVVAEAYPTGSWEPHPIKFVGPGAMLGEEAMSAADGVRASTIRALCELKLGVVYRDDLQRVMERSPVHTQFVLKLLIESLHASQHSVLARACGSANDRIIRLLLDADASLVNVSGAAMHVTQNDLARLAGLQRPTANRVLKDLESWGCIELRRSQIRVVDRSMMHRQLAGGTALDPVDADLRRTARAR